MDADRDQAIHLLLPLWQAFYTGVYPHVYLHKICKERKNYLPLPAKTTTHIFLFTLKTHKEP